jgi:hypothetical protein
VAGNVLRWAAACFVAPFFLQLLGFGQTALGAGLCGAVFTRGVPLGLQGVDFWYAVMFMLLLSVQLMYGGLLLLAPLIQLPEEFKEGLLKLGLSVAYTILAMFLITRTFGLPYPSSQGIAWGDAARLDPLSLLLIASSVVGAILLGKLLKQ